MSDQFKCVQCNGTFEKAWTDEEAMAEAEENFGEIPDDQREVVCDDCFEKMTAILPIDEFMRRFTN